jgi:predicted amidohydrolase YtcJ
MGVKLNHNLWSERTLPTASDLDCIPNPVLVQHVCAHTHIINSRAIKIIGETSFSGLPGVIRDSEGGMTGVLEEEEAHGPVRRYVESLPDNPDDWVEILEQVISEGIGEVHAVGPGIVFMQERIDIYERLRSTGKLPILFRFYFNEWPSFDGWDDWLAYGGYKIFIDGALGGRTAALREPFSDVDRKGVLLHTDEELYEIVKDIFMRGVQLMGHVIGDRGLDQFLNVLERLQSEGIESQLPIKLTHVELCHPDQVVRIGALKAFCDIQPGQLTTEASFLPSVLGSARMQHCFPLRSLINAGVIVAGSSDAPVEPTNPMIGIQASVVRHPAMNLDERITLHEALQLYTINAQKLVKNDHRKGLLLPGYLADITIFEKDLFAVEPENLTECKVAVTIVNGVVVFRRSS